MNQLPSRTAIVTGATGFIGSRLIIALARHGYRVAAVTRKDTASISNAAATWHTLEELSQAISRPNSVLFHLAGRAHVFREEAENPGAEFRAANVDLTIKVAERAARLGVTRFVFLSSIAVLGNKTPSSAYSEQAIAAPETDYGRSKLMAEEALVRIGHATGMEIVIVRPPMVYGFGAKGNYARLMSLLKLGLPLPFGAIDNKRSFIGAGNLTDFLIRCAEHNNAANQTFVISDDQDVSTTDFLRMSAEALGVRPLLIPIPKNLLRYFARILRQEAFVEKLVGDLRVDCTKAKQLLSWQPPQSIRDGMHSKTR